MGEIRHEVRTFLVDMVCESCGTGYMRPVGNIALSTYPIQYPHQCYKCGYTQNYIKKYPYETYEYWEEK